ncbi:hypothetical protein [Pseudomonas abietaniphila]|jgi:hypothetical protein
MFLDLKVTKVAETISEWRAGDVAAYKARKDNILIRLEAFMLNGDNILDASKIQQSVFPESDIDVFISHSHADQDQAIKVALSLEEIGLKPFVDSCVWAHADELLQKIDDVFSKPDGWTAYSYELRNRTTTNVHLILNAALQHMIQRAELFIFLGTKSSIKLEDHISNHEQLSSPWIFSELTFVDNAKRTPRKQIVVTTENEKFEARAADEKAVEFRYRLPDSTYTIEFGRFEEWLSIDPIPGFTPDFVRHVKGLEHLDRLYKMLGVGAALLDAPRFV